MRESVSDNVFTTVNYVLLGLFGVTVLYPLLFVLSASFSSPEAVMSGKVWIVPVEFNVEGYAAVFRHNRIMQGFVNSLYYAAAGTALTVAMTLLAAYPLARKDCYGRNIVMFYFVFTMFFGGGMIPAYLLVKQLGLLNTAAAMIIPGAVSVWNVIITRTYIQTSIPGEVLESAQMDGCNDFRFLRSFIVPLSLPVLAVVTLFCAVGYWNTYFNALLYLSDKKLYPLQLVLREILVQNEISIEMLSSVDMEEAVARAGMRELLKYSLIVVASAPLLILYPFIQKHFVKGVMLGSLKG